MLGRHCLAIVAIVAILLAACSPPGGETGETAFTERVAGQVRRELGDQATVRVSAPRTLEVRFADGTSLTASLDNLARDCELRPADCAASTATVARSIAQSHVAAGTGRREALMVTVKSRDWVDNARCAPSRDFVYFVGAGESPEVLQDFRSRMAAMASGESHSIALHILRWTPEGWVVEPG